MDIMNSSDDTSTENSIGLTDYYLSQQLPANAFLMQTIYNPNFLALQKELNILETELARLQRILEAKGRVQLNGTNPIDWDDSDGKIGTVQSSTIAYGHILHFKQVWRAAGYSLGDLLYSLPLAPGQKKANCRNRLGKKGVCLQK